MRSSILNETKTKTETTAEAFATIARPHIEAPGVGAALGELFTCEGDNAFRLRNVVRSPFTQIFGRPSWA